MYKWELLLKHKEFGGECDKNVLKLNSDGGCKNLWIFKNYKFEFYSMWNIFSIKLLKK